MKAAKTSASRIMLVSLQPDLIGCPPVWGIRRRGRGMRASIYRGRRLCGMQRGQAPDAIDTRLVFRIYSWIAIASGLVVFNSPLFVFPALLSERACPMSPGERSACSSRSKRLRPLRKPALRRMRRALRQRWSSTNISARLDDRNGGDDLQFHVRRRLGTSWNAIVAVIAAITVARYIAAWHRIREREVLA